jgi:hypothetical protein
MKLKLVYLEEGQIGARRNDHIIKIASFTRTLQKHITKTGAHYVLSTPREIAQVSS